MLETARGRLAPADPADPPPPAGQEAVATATMSAPLATAIRLRAPELQTPVVASPGWGLGMVSLGVPVIFGAAIVVTIFAAIFSGIDNIGQVGLPMSVLFFGLLGQQAAMGAWPLYVARRFGQGLAADLRLKFDRFGHDVVLGLAVGTAMIFVAGLMSVVASTVMSLEGSASNTESVTEAAASGWQWPTIALAVLGAPIVEELFFRGLLLRALEGKWGKIVAVALSSVVFTLIHYNGAGLPETVVLFSAIGTVAVVLGVVVVKTNRLLIAIVAHAVFNAMGVLAAYSVLA
ncbi:MAG: CPBP family intramembrane metalloprotease [Acidimicrobiales bacterium]|nr:CPBP family intramembrane metalloprotease [Acidimicrobiales bacterium]